MSNRLLFPLLVGSSAVLTGTLLAAEFSPGTTLNLLTQVYFFLVLGLEYVFPYRRDWQKGDGQLGQDLGHTLIGTGGGALAGNLTVGFVAPVLAIWLWNGHGWWPTHWPHWVQVPLIFLIADFGRYWQHRLHHSVPFLWRFHALHHDVERLMVLKTSRSHFVERYLQHLAMFGGLILFGCPIEVLIWYMVPNSVVGLLDHSNLDIELGRLERVLMGPRGHRLHHSAAPEDFDTNYGSALVVWDRVFGTFRDPVTVQAPSKVGVPGADLPKAFMAQLLWPLARTRPPAAKTAA